MTLLETVLDDEREFFTFVISPAIINPTIFHESRGGDQEKDKYIYTS